MTREEREQALKWFKNRPITMSGAKKMYDLAFEALSADGDTISRQAAIDALHTWFKDGFDEDKWWNSTHVLAAIEGLPPVQQEQRWIPCNERMPDEDYWTGANFQYSADVLMTVYNAEDEETIIDYGHTADGSWYSDTTDGPVPPWWEVLAWMPLPEPYKEVEQDG